MNFRIVLVGLCVLGLSACTGSKHATKSADSKSKAVETMDQDDDGILDSADKCPTEPETRNGYRDADGCPDMIPEKPAFQSIHYGVNSKDVPDESKQNLAVVAEALKQYPSLKIRIESHTDSYGVEAYNMELSKRRADAVKNWLVKTHGIDSGRMTAIGYGMSKPVASLNTKEGRMANRAIEFVIEEGWPPKE